MHIIAEDGKFPTSQFRSLGDITRTHSYSNIEMVTTEVDSFSSAKLYLIIIRIWIYFPDECLEYIARFCDLQVHASVEVSRRIVWALVAVIAFAEDIEQPITTLGQQDRVMHWSVV